MKHKLYNIKGKRRAKLGELETAISFYEKAISIKPEYVDAHYNVGYANHKLGRLDAAVKSYKKVVAISPDYATKHNNKILSVIYFFSKMLIPDAIDVLEELIKGSPNDALLFNMIGGCYASQGKTDIAIKFYEKALDLKPDYAIPQHMLNSLQGNTSKRPPKEYVKNLFDDYAERFDESLLNQLQYKLPLLIKDIVLKIDPARTKFDKVIDLGCGTGLSGENLQGISNNLTGIDISENMISKANELGIYDSLIAGDIVEKLDLSKEKYDLFIALDVFIYIGEITSMLSAVKMCANKNSFFIFSIETLKGEGYSLLKSSRYAHSDSYILEVASNGFELVDSQNVKLRKEGNKWIDGKIYILKVS
ncbi:tetratricopeptide repeat protein [Candidatus Pseudothioglobus sp. Uisw_016]|uniref:tetratricopeptide repeat protein n=1 Tax=Candidatus Pseudothioglobus sp. Uisw_016 TaxID=3230995 RepID=UPI003A893DD2